MRSIPFDLLLITDAEPQLCERVARALEGSEPGRVAVMLRRPGAPTAELLPLAEELRRSTRLASAALLVNDRIDIALAAEADGVHLPEASFRPETARRLLGADRYIGVSRHDAAGLAEAVPAADYATLSPIYPIEGKAPALGLPGFAQIAARAPLPLFALGGVRRSDVPSLRVAGAHGVAVIREVLAARDPAHNVRELLRALRTG